MNTNTAKSENYQRFVGFPKFASLIAGRTLEDYGVWQVFGEDSNPDLGGYHHTPLLATCEGKLGDVIEYAVDLPGFWTWGGGGEIKKICVVKVDAAANLFAAAATGTTCHINSRLLGIYGF